MEMDWGTALIGLISILICVVPVVLMHRNRMKREKKMLQELKTSAQQHECKISQHEFCGDFVIGIDEVKNFVFFVKQQQNQVVTKFVDLREMRTCNVVKRAQNGNQNVGSLSLIGLVELSFVPTNKTIGVTIFELYNEDSNAQLSGELQLVDKWAKQLNASLKGK